MSATTSDTPSILPLFGLAAAATLLSLGIISVGGVIAGKLKPTNVETPTMPWVPNVKVDSETGCEYIISGGSGVLTPRLNAHGNPVCGLNRS